MKYKKKVIDLLRNLESYFVEELEKDSKNKLIIRYNKKVRLTTTRAIRWAEMEDDQHKSARKSDALLTPLYHLRPEEYVVVDMPLQTIYDWLERNGIKAYITKCEIKHKIKNADYRLNAMYKVTLISSKEEDGLECQENYRETRTSSN